MKNTYLYDDIINMPHHESKTHKRMSMTERAGQFAPFAALTGFEGEVKETARLVDSEILLDEEFKEILDEKLKIIEAFIKDKPIVTITYFIPDKNKNGGKYETITGNIRIIDKVKQVIILSDKRKIDIDKILDIRSNILNGMV